MIMDKLYLLGYASGMGGVDPKTAEGPLTIQHSSFIKTPEDYQWTSIIHPRHSDEFSDVEVISYSCVELAKAVSDLTKKQKNFCVIGGDHTSAIGTFSGVFHAMQDQGDIGLIWIDAHMDSHTPETSISGRLHGMPLACLMGYGYPSLTGILEQAPKIKPENLCLIGVRSFENGESELLERLNVRVYFIEEVQERGVSVVLEEAIKQVSANTVAYGISLDMDAIDPEESPGVDVPEANGMNGFELSKAMAAIISDPKLIAMEIVEFDPSRDRLRKTEKLLVSLLDIIRHGKNA